MLGLQAKMASRQLSWAYSGAACGCVEANLLVSEKSHRNLWRSELPEQVDIFIFQNCLLTDKGTKDWIFCMTIQMFFHRHHA
jgi:hypothetical protein